jgi:hypothetical protein
LHRVAAQGRAGPTFRVVARTWSSRATLCSDQPEIFSVLRYLECDPEIDGPVQNFKITIDACDAGYRIKQDGQLIGEQPSPHDVAGALHEQLVMLSLADFPRSPLIHAASLTRLGHRLLLVGPKGGGKTTLTLKLIQQGYGVEGDENVFVTGDAVAARPRALRIKQSTSILYPAIGDALREAAYYENENSLRIYNLDPRKAGASRWRIEMGRADTVVLLRPNHNGNSSLRPISPLHLVREVISETAFREGNRAEAVANIAGIVRGARGFQLWLGDLEAAASCLDAVLI